MRCFIVWSTRTDKDNVYTAAIGPLSYGADQEDDLPCSPRSQESKLNIPEGMRKQMNGDSNQSHETFRIRVQH